MHFERKEPVDAPDPFARYPSQTYSVLPDGLLRAMVEKGVGRNGWAVMMALCHVVYGDGILGRMPAKCVAEITGLTEYQIARGMTELRNKKIIVPVMRTTAEGYRHHDRSNLGHVAQYCICKDVWNQIERIVTPSELKKKGRWPLQDREEVPLEPVSPS